jgi:hypothetical protein
MTTQLPLVNDVLLVHSPTLSEARVASLRIIDARLAVVSATGLVHRLTGDEPMDVVARVQLLVDVDASHMTDPAFQPLIRNLHVKQVSNTMKHIAAMQRIAGNSNPVHRFSLVVEDDALFSDNVTTALGYAISDAPADADIIFLGLPSPKSPPSGGGAVFDEALTLFGVLPACDSYLVTRAAAERLSTTMLPVRFPTNVQLTYAIKTLGLRAYVAVPNVFVDGSKLGVFTGSLEPNNRLIWNQPYCKMDALIKNPDAYVSGKAAGMFDASWQEQPFKEHPDVLVLKAAHLAKMGCYREAEGVYASALVSYDKNGVVVNNTSEFLRSYIALHRNLQEGV